MDCSRVVYCGGDEVDAMDETAGNLIRSICDKSLIRKCGDTIYIVQNLTISCLTDCRESGEPEQLPWVRPVTCAAIAVSALVFFTILYFGKSWTESREFERIKRAAIKGTDRRQLRKQAHAAHAVHAAPTPTATAERTSWSRLKISVLAGSRAQAGDIAAAESQKSNQTRRDTELELAMFDAKS